nr:hypothetical protein [uncultured Enterocloster sp.]
MEELEKRIDQKTEELDTAEKERVEAEKIREENERQRLNNEREWQVQGEKAVQAAKDAQAAASAAEKEKTAAKGYSTAAGGSAEKAKQYAEAASTSAANADASAKRAEEIAEGLGGFDGSASSVSAVDTHNLTGAGAGKKSTVQNLLDVIAQKLVEKVVTSDTFQTVLAKYLVNNGLTTETGKFALDAAYGKNLQDQITQQNSKLAYKIMSSGDVLALERGYYYAYPECINLPPDTDQAFWLSVNGIDNDNKIIEAIPAGSGHKYFYKAKKNSNTWLGWEKYTSVI